MVSAVVAHLKARFPAANYCQITEALYDSAVLPPSTASVSGRSVTAGIVDPQAAITSLGSILASIQWAKIHQPGSVTPCDPPPMDTTPAILVSDSDHAAIGVGFGHACTLNEVGNIACWGNNDHGQHVPSDAGRFVSVAAGQYYTCAIRDDGTIDCWGNNVYIQADNIPGNKDEEFMSVTAGRNHICAIRDDGTIACWGYPYDGQVSDAPTITGAGHFTDASVYTSISAGSDHTCAINLEGDIHCWGKEDDGRADNQTDGPYIAVAAGEAHTCALRKSGAAACWGNNDYGQATPPGGDFVQHNYVAITAGTEHTCGLKNSGTILCWGNEADGRTTVSPRLRPADVMSNISVIAAGGATTCALAEGATHCWGKTVITNTGGTLSKFAGAAFTITASRFHTCAIRDDGTVECWGDNDHGQADPPPGEFTAITSGTWHTCGIRTDGTAQCWEGITTGRRTLQMASSQPSPPAFGTRAGCVLIGQPNAGDTISMGRTLHRASSQPSPLLMRICAEYEPTGQPNAGERAATGSWTLHRASSQPSPLAVGIRAEYEPTGQPNAGEGTATGRRTLHRASSQPSPLAVGIRAEYEPTGQPNAGDGISMGRRTLHRASSLPSPLVIGIRAG